jgi:DNA-binding response OmpR family regulator
MPGSTNAESLPVEDPSTASEPAVSRPVRILVIEDNPGLASAIQRGLIEHGYQADVVLSGIEGEERAASGEYDMVVLDLMLPDRDGIEVCRNLRRRKVSTYVIMLTALSGTTEKITGLNAGADDYLGKPFEFAELVARIRALLRRGKPAVGSALEYGGLRLDLLRRQVSRDGQRIHLRAKEFALLEYFLRNTDRVVDRTSIAQKVWEMNYEPASNVIDKYVSSLRKKIDRGHDRPLIHTVVGVGYRLGEAEDGQ